MGIVNVKAEINQLAAEYLNTVAKDIKELMEKDVKKAINDFYRDYKPIDKRSRYYRFNNKNDIIPGDTNISRAWIEHHRADRRSIFLRLSPEYLSDTYPKWVTPFHIFNWSIMQGGHGWLYNISSTLSSGEKIYMSKYHKKKLKSGKHRKYSKKNELRKGRKGFIPAKRLQSFYGKTGSNAGGTKDRKIVSEIMEPADRDFEIKIDKLIDNILGQLV